MILIKVNIHELEVHKEVRVSFSENQKFFELENSDFVRFKGKIEGKLYFTKEGDTVYGKGDIFYQVSLLCSRCLEYKEIDIRRDFYRFYERDCQGREFPEEIELSAGALDVVPYSGDEIIINEDLRDEILLGIPEFFFCSTECKGLCEKCGENLNIHPEHECKKKWTREKWQIKLTDKYRQIKGGNNNGGS